MRRSAKVPNWEVLLAHAATLQMKVPGAVLVGGTAAAVHARHRSSVDHDHVVKDLAKGYEAALHALESIVGWRTRRRIKGTLVLGEVDSIPAGLRNQRRSAPLETIDVAIRGGGSLRVPTAGEILRIKTFLVVDRNATRDYLDVAALSHYIGLKQSCVALERMNELYSEFAGEAGDMLTSAVVKLATPDPYDLTDIDLTEYKGVIKPWDDWRAVGKQCGSLAAALLHG